MLHLCCKPIKTNQGQDRQDATQYWYVLLQAAQLLMNIPRVTEGHRVQSYPGAGSSLPVVERAAARRWAG